MLVEVYLYAPVLRSKGSPLEWSTFPSALDVGNLDMENQCISKSVGYWITIQIKILM